MPPAPTTQHLTKTVPVEILETKTAKAADGAPLGIVRAKFSVYGHVDSYGDATQPGCFQPLIDYVKAGGRLPYVFAHNSWDLSGYIGVITDVTDEADGPVCTAELFLDDPEGAKAFRLLEARAVTQHSYQYAVQASHIEQVDGAEPVNALDLLEVFEIGPCLRGAVDTTDVLDTKGLKAGRVLSAANETALREGLAAIADGIAKVTTVLDQVAATDSGTGKTPDAEEPTGANAPATKAHGTTAEDWAALKELAGIGALDD